MTVGELPAGVAESTAIVDASAALLEELASAAHPLGIVSDALSRLATALRVERAVVAIDDAVYGRQVFTSGRCPVGVEGSGLWGPPGIITEPAHRLDERLARLIVAAVGTAFERARSAPTPTSMHGTSTEIGPVESAAAAPAALESTSSGAEQLLALLRAATERSTRYGWGFTLVLARFDHLDEPGLANVEAQLRGGDTLVRVTAGELGIVLPAAAGDEVPQILVRFAHAPGFPAFSYGLAACPGDADAAEALLALARLRLHDADESRHADEIRTLEPPKV